MILLVKYYKEDGLGNFSHFFYNDAIDYVLTSLKQQNNFDMIFPTYKLPFSLARIIETMNLYFGKIKYLFGKKVVLYFFKIPLRENVMRFSKLKKNYFNM